jgi:two-component system LytT family response regulator
MLRTVIVDDEELARDRLKQLLRPYEDIDVVGEAEDGQDAIDTIMDMRPDLVFLDIQMPAASGTEVAASLPSPRPAIVFCTAFDEYAVDAFELNAVDYLLKPVNRSRLAKTLERVRRITAEEKESKADEATRAMGGFPSRFLGKKAGKFQVISQGDVLFFVSEGGLTKLCTRDSYYWMQPTLTDLEKRIDPTCFFRISRAAIVNLETIKEVAPLMGGHGQVLLTNGAYLEVSRRRFKDLLEKIGQT